MKSKILRLVALAFAGAVTLGCSKERIGQEVTLTTTVSLAQTKALDADGHKSFEAGDRIAVVYENTGSVEVMTVSDALPAGSYGSTANFTVTLTDPKAGGSVKIIYPAAMAKADGSVNYDALAAQDGTLSSLAANLDLAMFEGSLTAGAALPGSPTLTNRLAICAFTLKSSDGTDDITSSITSLQISDGTNSYAVSRAPAAGPIYVAMRPVTGASIHYDAQSSTGYYVKSVSGKTYAANNLYSLGLRMTPLGKFTVSSGKQVYFSKGNLQAATSDNGSSWTWSFAANQWDFIGNATANTSIDAPGHVSANGIIDLFGWSGASSVSDNYGINNSITNSHYGASAGESLLHDWGHNAISNGGNTADRWRTLTKDEWLYVFTHRATTSGIKYAKATVNGVNGIVLLPDDWSTSYHALTVSATPASDNYSVNVIDASTWMSSFEAHGAVFLPAAGVRAETTVYSTNSGYWSATAYDKDAAYLLYFTNFSLGATEHQSRSSGYSVRLVKDVTP